MKSLRYLLLVAAGLFIVPTSASAAYWDYSIGAINYSPVRLPYYGATFVSTSMAYATNIISVGNVNSDSRISNADLQSFLTLLRPGNGTPSASLDTAIVTTTAPNIASTLTTNSLPTFSDSFTLSTGSLSSGNLVVSSSVNSADIQSLLATIRPGAGETTTTSVPEPSTFILSIVALASLAASRRLARNKLVSSSSLPLAA